MLRPSIRGFTIVELLVVLAIIGVLATVILANLNQGRDRAAVANELRQLQEIEKALRVYLIDDGRAQWWRATGGSFITINQLRADNPGLEDFLQPLGRPYLNPNREYQYANYNSDPASDCNDRLEGISIRIDQANAVNADAMAMLDDEVDGGDGSDCGRIRWGGSSNSLYYIIANDIDDL